MDCDRRWNKTVRFVLTVLQDQVSGEQAPSEQLQSAFYLLVCKVPPRVLIG